MNKWYCGDIRNCEQGVIQVDDDFWKRGVRPTVPIEILRIAHDEYNDQGHPQSFSRLQERGGFSALEVIYLLADRCNRLKQVKQ